MWHELSDFVSQIKSNYLRVQYRLEPIYGASISFTFTHKEVLMALISCPDCNNEVSERAASCPKCGAPISTVKKDVKVRFPVWQGQIANNKCYVFCNGVEVASCRQGETATFILEKPSEISVKVGGGFGKPSIEAAPGDRFEVGFRGFGKVFISKVDVLA